MIKTISDTMNLSFMENLLKQQCPCSLIIDSSTSKGLYHYMTVLIQTLENECPLVYFYAFIDVGIDSSADGLMKALLERLSKEQRDLTGYLKEKGFGADGASVNIGHKGGFIAKL